MEEVFFSSAGSGGVSVLTISPFSCALLFFFFLTFFSSDLFLSENPECIQYQLTESKQKKYHDNWK